MDAAVTKAPKQSWRRLTFALAGFILLPLLPMQLQLVLPIVDTALLVVPVVAVCAITAWLAGGKASLAGIWVLLAVWVLAMPLGTGAPAYEGMAKGWALLLAGSFGLMSIWSSTTPFIVRALAALGIAIAAGFILAVSSPGGIDRYERATLSEYTRRETNLVAGIEARTQSKAYRDFIAKSPEFDRVFDDVEAQIKAIPPRSAVLLPAFLALESLAGLGLSWAVFSRMSAQPIGPPLSKLREFRFSDQLVWGVAVGATLIMLPSFEEGKSAGLNLLVFFGTLYFLRGMGVLAWMTRGRKRLIGSSFLGAALLTLFVPAVGALILAALIQLTLFGAMLLGLGDTWLDWRSRPAA